MQAIRMADWLMEHYEPANGWDDPIGFCAWFISLGFCGTVHDGNDIIAMVGMRPVKELGDGAVPYRYDPDGDFIHVDFLVGTGNPRAIPALAAIFKQRFGPRKSVSYFRRSEERLRVHEYDRFFKNVSRNLRKVT
jgi:hypothetical protein